MAFTTRYDEQSGEQVFETDDAEGDLLDQVLEMLMSKVGLRKYYPKIAMHFDFNDNSILLDTDTRTAKRMRNDCIKLNLDFEQLMDDLSEQMNLAALPTPSQVRH